MKNKPLKPHPALSIALIATVVAVSGWLFLKRYQIEVEVTSPAQNQNTVPILETTPTASANPNAIASKPPESEKPDPVLAAARQGSLRVSNRSNHPLRVALLARQPKDSNAKAGSAQTGFALPAHWDFAPNEGSDRGLLVSLPNQTIRLKRGDIVVAFAQDGSQRYWGPFVVGETQQPAWNPQTAEWELTVEE